MQACVLIVALLSVAAFGQTITGTVESVGKDQLQVKSAKGLVTLQVEERTVVRKTRTRNNLSALEVGDEVRISYYGEGTLTAVNISARVTFSGVITEAGATRIMVRPALTSDETPPERKTVFVFLDPDTKLGVSRSQLTVGRRVQIVGWDAGDGVVDAERVAVYDADVPARPPARPKQ